MVVRARRTNYHKYKHWCDILIASPLICPSCWRGFVSIGVVAHPSHGRRVDTRYCAQLSAASTLQVHRWSRRCRCRYRRYCRLVFVFNAGVACVSLSKVHIWGCSDFCCWFAPAMRSAAFTAQESERATIRERVAQRERHGPSSAPRDDLGFTIT